MINKNKVRFLALLTAVTCTSTLLSSVKYASAAETFTNVESISDKYDMDNSKASIDNIGDIICSCYEGIEKDFNSENIEQLKIDIAKVKNSIIDLLYSMDKSFEYDENIIKKLNVPEIENREREFKEILKNQLNNLNNLYEDMYTEIENNDICKAELILKDIYNISFSPSNSQSDDKTVIDNEDFEDEIEYIEGGEEEEFIEVESVALYSSALSSNSDVDENLLETAETNFTDEIKEKANSLGTAVKIYEYLKNNVKFESYYGSRKGAAGTLEEMSGNDFDQASLLIAMLRYKGIPARYVRGTIQISVEAAEAWTGAETATAAAKILSSLGIPAKCIIVGGEISALQVEHVWVEAYVNSNNYQRTKNKAEKKRWVPLDTSFKNISKVSGADIEEITGISISDDILEKNDSSTEEIVSESLKDKLLSQRDELEKYLITNNAEDSTWLQVLGGYEIISQKLGILPSTLPFEKIASLGEYQSIDDEFKDKIKFNIAGSSPNGGNFTGIDEFNYMANASDLYGKKISLSWVPATEDDEKILAEYGGIYLTPAYMIKLKPELKIDDEVVAVGSPVGMGYKQQFTTNFISRRGEVFEKTTNIVTAGSRYCMGLDYSNISGNKLKEYKKNILDSNFELDKDQAIDNILNLAVINYFAQTDIHNKILANKLNVKESRALSFGIAGYEADIEYILNSPVKIKEGKMYLDIDRDKVSAISINDDLNNQKSFNIASGMIASIMQNKILEKAFNTTSVSAVKALGKAAEAGIPIYTINKRNLNSVLEKVDLSDSIKNMITNNVNSGKEITIPKSDITINNWTGVGYIVLDKSTGSADYRLSNNISGSIDTEEKTCKEYIDAAVSNAEMLSDKSVIEEINKNSNNVIGDKNTSKNILEMKMIIDGYASQILSYINNNEVIKNAADDLNDIPEIEFVE